MRDRARTAADVGTGQAGMIITLIENAPASDKPPGLAFPDKWGFWQISAISGRGVAEKSQSLDAEGDAKMKGHIRQRSAGRWAIVLDIHDAKTGRRRRKWHSFQVRSVRRKLRVHGSSLT